MSKLKLKQYEVLQLAVFLDRIPMKDFTDIKSFRKVAGGVELLQKGLGEYYNKFAALELETLKYLQPFQQEANEVRNSYLDIFSKDDKELTPEEKAKKLEFQMKIEKINAKASKDKNLKKANDDFNAFQVSENEKEVEIEITNPEYAKAMKDEFEARAIKYEGWLNKKVPLTLSESLEAL